MREPGRASGGAGFTLARALGLCGVFLVLVVAAFLVAVRFGDEPISLSTVLGDPGSTDAVIFWSLRLPRALLAAIVGAGLAASGSTLQGVLRNPLADPFILGVSGGAALGATLALAVGLGTVGQVASGLTVGLARLSAPALFAFLGAAAAMVFVLVASQGHGGRAPYAALLIGVVFNSFASAAITVIKTLSDPNRLGEIVYWLVGSLGYERIGTLALSALLQGGAIGVMLALSGRLNLLTLGDDDAASLGVSVAATRRVLLLAASASVAGAVAISGLIGFVGLIVPHLLRLAFGPDQRLLVPLSALGGAAFLMLADLLARLALPLFGNPLPVGAVTALLGGPLFLSLLYRSGRVPVA
ncbi:iron ABC transporter permease [Vitiosangium sp. GDMCC 1.1324]|uniref:FecCD family ABC transporter permease n=1 Tax=Vitiosangium sp. (strain GDMCC 1.1324) TaxID=2138576 RepID=UPI000D33A8CE|nr:iron ABC transporter permease [Vitiosangium sp. GDMCC 1.1324]PTL81361.1 iron ABC transporter [Vitiosangium sp. GDMCC 1.1324]